MMNKSLIITGADGQLGSSLKTILGDKARYLTINDLDISDEKAVAAFFESEKNACVINCAAYTAVDKAEDETDISESVNNYGARYLARYAKNIIHISTDYVFDGTSNTPYTENMEVNPVSVYGASKLRGEQAALEEADTAVIIRTSWLYTAKGNNFLNTMLRLGAQRKELNVVFDQVGTPTYAPDLAQAIVEIIPQVKTGTKEIYHFSNEGVCSWYDFAVEIMNCARLPCSVFPILSAQYPTKAKRPAYSVFDKSKIKKDFGIKILHWRAALNKAMSDRENLR